MSRWTNNRIHIDGIIYTATQAVDQVIFHIPADADTSYKFVGGRLTEGTVSTSGTLRPRVIRAGSVEAPGATASATCIELAAAMTTAGTAETVVNATPVDGVIINPGDRIALKTGGTQTNLVSCCFTFVLEPLNSRL
jgi:hypothetical protein